MDDRAGPVQIQLHLNLGQGVRFMDCNAPGVALQLRSSSVEAINDTLVTVQDDATCVTWTLFHAATLLQADSRVVPQAPTPAQRPTGEDFRVSLDAVTCSRAAAPSCASTRKRSA